MGNEEYPKIKWILISESERYWKHELVENTAPYSHIVRMLATQEVNGGYLVDCAEVSSACFISTVTTKTKNHFTK